MAKASLPGSLSDGELNRLEQRVLDAIRVALILDDETPAHLKQMRRVIQELKMRRDRERQQPPMSSHT